MKENTSYIKLITSWEEYLRTGGEPTVERYARYVLENVQTTDGDPAYWMSPDTQQYFHDNTSRFEYTQHSSEAATLIWRLHKFIRMYTKPIIQEMGLASNDEFAILATVDIQNQCSKKAAIEENLIEATTGIDMIRRMLKLGLLLEKPLKEDKRVKMISLSAKGKKTLYTIYQKFAGIQDVLGKLEDADRIVLLRYLKELDQFHSTLPK